MSIERAVLSAWLRDARQRTFDLVRDLADDELFGPRIEIINPLHWEIGHVAWFQEKWLLRTARGEAPERSDGDALYDSMRIPHDDRWDLPLPSRAATLQYLERVRDRALAVLEAREPTPEERYFALLGLFHEDMHDEAFTYTRQTLSYRPPAFTAAPSALDPALTAAGPCPGDVRVPGGTLVLGADPSDRGAFVFDNEKWAHEVAVAPFSISRGAVTTGELLAFVQDGGYRNLAVWSEGGRRWLASTRATHPVYWRQDASGRWLERRFDRWTPIEDAPHRAMIHVCWWEAEAYAAWAGRRLPTEAEWEAAALGAPDPTGTRLSRAKRRFPWGDEAPRAGLANLDGHNLGTIDTGALPAGDSAFGVRQMIGNTWEWTSTPFAPYPGFVPDPYEEYSQPWFGDHLVLRGGCWATRARLIRGTWRNFYRPNRRDVFAGFRTVAR